MKKILATVLVICMMMTFASFPAMAETVNPYRVKIFTMGDSFTQGVIEPNAYRYYIYENLIQDGAVFEFIGPHTSIDYRVTDLYNKHGGYGGAVIGCAEDYNWNGSAWVTSSWEKSNADGTATIKYGGTKNSIHYRLFAGSDGSDDYTKTEYGNYVAEADIVTLYIGLNDYYSSGTNGLSCDLDLVKERYYEIVDRIYEINPDVSLYVTDLNEVNGLRGVDLSEGEAGYENSVYKYNEFILNEVVAHYTEDGKKIAGISLNQEGYKMGSGDTPSDDGHPNEKGNRKIGTQIYMGIKDEVLALNAQGSDVAYNPTRVTSVTLDKTSATLKTGENLTLTSTIAPTSAEIISVIFSSSNESVATVDGYGRVTAVGEGTATIYATALDSLRPEATEIKAACNVTVTSDEYAKIGENFLPVFHEKFDATGPWTGDTEKISVSGSVFKHYNVTSSSVTSQKTVDLNTKFSMAFNVAIIGHESREVTESNRENYYASLTVGKYQLRVGINGKTVGFYYNGTLKAERTFAVPVTRQNEDRYTLAKDGATVYVYRNNELLFTSAVDEDDTAEGQVSVTTKGYGIINIRDVELKSIRGLVKLNPTAIKYSTNTTYNETSYPITNALDGNLATDYSVFAWKGSTPVAWTTDARFVILDLGDYYDVSNLNIYWGHQGGAWGKSVPDAYNVSYSADNSTYTPALSYSGIYDIMVGNATENFSSINTSFAVTAPSWTSGTSRSEYGYGNVKESELGWEGVRYIKIEMTSVTNNPTIAEIEVFTTQYMEGEEPEEEEKVSATYTVNYVDKDGNPVADAKTVNTKFVGNTVTENAVAVTGYTVDEKTKTITLVDGTNTVTFTYTKNEAKKITIVGATSNQAAENGDNTIAKAFDGNYGTTWGQYYKIAANIATTQKGEGQLLIDLDLGAPYNITQLNIAGLSCCFTGFALYGSNDLTGEWTEIADLSVNDRNKTELAVSHEGYYRYIRFEGYKVNYTGQAGIEELELFGTLDPSIVKIEGLDAENISVLSGTLYDTKSYLGQSNDFSVFFDGVTDSILNDTTTDAKESSVVTFKTIPANGAPVMVIDLGEKYDLATIGIYWGFVDGDWWGSYAPNAYKIEVSADGAEYTEIYAKSGAAAARTRTDTAGVYGTADAVQYIKITVTECNASDGTAKCPAIREIELYGASAEVKVPATYTVNYVDEDGNPVADAKTVDTKLVGDTVTETAITVEDYTVDEETKSITLVADAASNVITFTYTEKQEGAVSATLTPITVSNSQSGYPIENAVDGSLTTAYATSLYMEGVLNATNAYVLKFDTGAVKTLDSLTISWGLASPWGYQFPEAYNVYVSADDSDYTLLKSYEAMQTSKNTYDGVIAYSGSTAVVTETNLNANNVRYIKIELIGWKYRCALAEIAATVKDPDSDESTNDPRVITPIGGNASNGTGGAAVTATSIANLIDGNQSTYTQIDTTNFNKENGPAAEYVFNFDNKYQFKNITVSWSVNRMTATEIYVSNDGTNWGSPVYTSSSLTYGNANSIYTATIELPAGVIGRYIKIVAVDLVGYGWPHFNEVEFVASNVVEKVASLGGDIRLPNAGKGITAGLRFGAKIIKENVGIEGTYVYSDNAEIKFGMFMIPKDMLSGQTLTAYLANGVQNALDVPAKKFLNQDDNVIEYTAVLVDIPSSYNDREITAVPYVLKDGTYTYFDEMTKSYAGVATAARQSTYSDSNIYNATGTKKDELIEIAYQLDCIIKGTDPNYDPTASRTITKTFEFEGTSLGSTWYTCPEGARQGGSYWEDDMTRLDGNGNLILSAQWNSSLNDGNGYLMTGGVRTMTKNYSATYSAGYGYYEARIKFPNAHKGAWGAFWQMVGDMNSNTANGAADGVEIDIIESINNEAGKCNSALHWDGYSTNAAASSSTYFNHNIYDGNWHTIGLERTAEGYKFYIDGRLMWFATADEVAPSSLDGYLKLTVEAAPWAVNNTSDYSVYSAYMSETYAEKTDIMVVDYVKVWED